MTATRRRVLRTSGKGSNRRLRWMLLWYGFTHPVTPIPPWRLGPEADAIRRRHFDALIARWRDEGKLACECCGRRGESVAYTGHVGTTSLLCCGCAFGVECLAGRCAPWPES